MTESASSAPVAIAHLLRAHASIEERLSNGMSAIHGLSLKELMLLMYLDTAPAHKLSRVELARCLNMSASTVTRQTAPLEKRGLVSKDSDPRDARLSYVVLTPAGQELVRDARLTFEQSAETFFQDRWTAYEVDVLAEMLGRLTSNLPGTLLE